MLNDHASVISTTIDSDKIKTCKRCGSILTRGRGRSKKQWEERAYCSKKCAALKRDKSIDKNICDKYLDGYSCDEIGSVYGLSGVHVCRILKEYNIHVDQYRQKKGGISITPDGYLRFNLSASNGKQAGRRLHDIIAEMTAGRPLKKTEVVHHVDGNRLNNDPRNLVIMTRGEHTRLHKRMVKKCSISLSE